MKKFIKNSLLKYIPDNFVTEEIINPERIFIINNSPIQKGPVIYLCERELRLNDNFAIRFAIQKSEELKSPLKIIHKKIKYEVPQKQNFIDEQINFAKKNFIEAGLDFEVIEDNILECLKNLNPSLLIIDFNPLTDRKIFKKFPYRVYEIDSHNIVPARFVSSKQEYNASTFRRKVYFNIYPFLTEFKNISSLKTPAQKVLEDFIKNKLSDYNEFKNNPVKDVTSGLSKYLNLGFISSQRAAIEVIKSDVDTCNKEAFLEELIIRKELAENFCLYCKNYKDFFCVSNWAKNSLKEHLYDIRPYVYSLNEFENSKTHDALWNASQKQLVNEGFIHGYLRMYWAKKILEWSESPENALKTAVYLNDKYSFDSPSSNGYTGILWAIAGLHDRAFRDFFITGKIRRMTFDSLKKKFKKYIEKYQF